jgi:protein-S-isoprenylcysteine O-methyltransferase Ste14
VASLDAPQLMDWPRPHLVVAGPYRFVRIPMITAVLLIIVGELLSLRAPVLALWAAVFLLVNEVYFPLFEEPQRERRFGEDYRQYKRHVPRFVPRIRPGKQAIR